MPTAHRSTVTEDSTADFIFPEQRGLAIKLCDDSCLEAALGSIERFVDRFSRALVFVRTQRVAPLRTLQRHLFGVPVVAFANDADLVNHIALLLRDPTGLCAAPTPEAIAETLFPRVLPFLTEDEQRRLVAGMETLAAVAAAPAEEIRALCGLDAPAANAVCDFFGEERII